MNDIKLQFREWLKQQSFKDSTIGVFIRTLNKLTNKNWRLLQDNILPYMVKYYELANKEYFLDRVTIWQALDYFSRISESFNGKKPISSFEEAKEAKLYLSDGKIDYFICDTNITTLHADLLLLNSYLYYPDRNLAFHEDSSIDILMLSVLMQKLSKESQISELRSLGIHIVYNKSSRNIKTALMKYLDFLNLEFKTDIGKVHEELLYTQKCNPNKTLNKNFEEIQPITGRQPRQVRPLPNTRRDTEFGFVYSQVDLAAIFNINFNAAGELMDDFGKEYKISTRFNNYYSSSETNKCLAAYHHFKDKNKDTNIDKKANRAPVHLEVNYDKRGYEQWGTREEVMKQLGIKKAAFYAHVYKICSYIDYAKKAPKYYLPELKYFKNLPKIRRIRTRKNNIKTISNNKKRTLINI